MPGERAGIEIPRELRIPSPRRVRLRAERRRAIYLKVFFAAVLDIPGVLFLLYAAFDPFLVRLVPPTPATITYLKISRNTRLRVLRYHVGYSYALAGKRLTDDESVPEEFYHSLHVGQTVQVCAVQLGPFHYVEMQNGNRRLFGVLGLAWNLMFMLFLFSFVTLPRRLIRRGEAALGKITGKSRGDNAVTCYCINYKFQTPNAETRDCQMIVARRYYDQAIVGAEVVVLYDLKPDGSFQSLIYEFCDYVAG